ncbi:DUF6294 family protein [Planomonospora parontospora]|uniref:DUF6294 family protein n=1 Tax=Planomonospora parontospora TaxID=58119 RepID=UPI0016707B9E|nr:DUF6294 family protein [Planomonospora parontospora]GGL42937.1 hypothetical protein GCM10014719_50360 [Planomonospora parontospora subsp. antibiotica]GII18542.1 hypothetical protein Ppa05_52680 [Planomonospora parontospora subsp. antibiotica]
MKRAVRGAAALAVAGFTVFTTLPASASAGSAASALAQAEPLRKKTFIWRGYMSAGMCTIEPGATWTLYSNGTARLNAIVSSLDGDDAWLMWAHLKDSRGRQITDMQVYGSTSTKFVRNLPDGRDYRWIAWGQFDPDLFDTIKRMSLSKHC